MWLREFYNFIFTKENNELYAGEAAILPNTTDAVSYAAKKYGADPAKDITMCGQIRFSDSYNGFTPIANALKDVMKCSAQKYMVALNKDAAGSPQYETDEKGDKFLYLGNGETKIAPEYVGEEDSAMPGSAFCTLPYYLNNLEGYIAKYQGK